MKFINKNFSRLNKNIDEKKFKKLLKRQYVFEIILWTCFTSLGIFMFIEWPIKWFIFLGKYSNYLGIIIAFVSILNLIKSIYLLSTNKSDKIN